MNTRKSRAAFLTLTVAALVAVAPAAAQTASEEKRETPADVSERTTVHVISDNWQDVTVYAVRGAGYRIRLGTVGSFTSRVFTLPPAFLPASDQLRLVADPIGRRGAYVSGPFFVNVGDVVEWRLLNDIRLSNIFVYRLREEGL